MKKQLLFMACLLTLRQARAQDIYRQTLSKINHKIEYAYLHHDPDRLLQVYANEAASMPEYHLTLFGKKAIGSYLRQWMDSATVRTYSRQTSDVTKAGHYLVETGTFHTQFVLRQTHLTDYQGKYLAVWKIQPGSNFKLISEVTGSVKYIDRADLPLSAAQIPDTALLPKPKADAASRAIQTLDDQVAAWVVERKGAEFAKYYTPDAIYGPYYTPMLMGKTAIDAYYREHEDPNNIIDAAHIGTTRIITAGNYVLADAYYKVEWGGTAHHGFITGKNISVWKRGHDGRLLVFRQMAVHD